MEEKAEIQKQYQLLRPSLERLSNFVSALVSSALLSKEIPILQVQSRVKHVESFEEKFQRKNYSSIDEVTDLVGARVIVFFEKDVVEVEKVIRSYFDIDEINSVDKSAERSVDQVGYRSSHLVCRLGNRRHDLPEYEGLANIAFELQIRTTLQHAWAEIEHKQNYKAKRALPPALMRRLNIASATLEGLDQEFSRIVLEAREYENRITSEVGYDLEGPLNISSLKKTMPSVALRFGLQELEIKDDSSKRFELIIEELERFGVANLSELWALVDRVDKAAIAAAVKSHGFMRFVGFLRYIMYADNFESYLEKAYIKSFSKLTVEGRALIEETNQVKDLAGLLAKHGVSLPQD